MWILLLLFTAAGQGDMNLLKVAETYETLGRFLRDLGLLPQVNSTLFNISFFLNFILFNNG